MELETRESQCKGPGQQGVLGARGGREERKEVCLAGRRGQSTGQEGYGTSWDFTASALGDRGGLARGQEGWSYEDERGLITEGQGGSHLGMCEEATLAQCVGSHTRARSRRPLNDSSLSFGPERYNPKRIHSLDSGDPVSAANGRLQFISSLSARLLQKCPASPEL